ncbi:leucyl/phenylalanyl-tRNA--protein transferase [Nocardioides zeae]|uniref:Leucyl/phenylalanyl-tRNA--protein transferase n=1 Tax=Nocardioides imazamoxiresistens TaxID=3231893 RepID=A0ABU3PVC7_9ACTN|nr:leucyl/phenylalanyl-tRNA--protein transferase [Nocardioides zeae]MDT9593201.1 leucyl/phenylalanyl-tRNA--protein transferase [Nocardioides zeae]
MPVEPSPTFWDFDDPRLRSGDDDVVGAGADLEPGTLLAAYRHGQFPMPDEDRLLWFSPVRRGVLPLGRLRVSRSLRRSLRDYEIRVDTAFAEVVDACADPSRTGAWIDDRVAEAYTALHELGWAHSVEAWWEGRLVGGLYGVAIGGLFAGESMFHHRTDASKAALVGLVEILRADEDEVPTPRLLDVQWQTRHLASLGVTEIERNAYLDRLEEALLLPPPPAFADA